jgi:hypothetical protein
MSGSSKLERKRRRRRDRQRGRPGASRDLRRDLRGIRLVTSVNLREKGLRREELLQRALGKRRAPHAVADRTSGARTLRWSGMRPRVGAELGELVLIAAHRRGDVGVRAAGLQAICIDRLEKRWPFPLDEPPCAAGSVEAAELALAGIA